MPPTPTPTPPFHITPAIERLIDLAMEEDIGGGDITTAALVDTHTRGTAEMIAKEPLVMAGGSVAARVFEKIDATCTATAHIAEGDHIGAGNCLITVTGPLYALLTGERTALNFVQHLSGIATHVRSFADIAAGSRVRLVDTRKTIPGWRPLAKYAVRVGGCANHRTGLFDGVLIKDNHITACGGIYKAVAKARKTLPHLSKIEVEVSSPAELDEALAAGVDVIMLDNMDITTIKSTQAIDRDGIGIVGLKYLFHAQVHGG